MKSLVRLLTAFLIEGTAAAALALFTFFPLSGASPDEAISATKTHVSDAATWMDRVFSEDAVDKTGDVSDARMVELPARSEAEVAARLDHAAADFGASVEREIDRFFAPFSERDPHAAARSD